MKIPNLKKWHYKLLGFVGIVATVFTVIIILMGDTIFREQIVAYKWDIVHSEDADMADKFAALQYLAQRDQSLAKLNFSGKKTSLQGLTLAPTALEFKGNVDLRNANFMQANLSNINFSEAILSNAILSGTNLSYARLHNVDLSDANLRNADLTGTNLSGANLSNADLTGAKLLGTDLTAANLTATNLANADLFAVNISSAILEETVFNQATAIQDTWIWRTKDEQPQASYLPSGIPKNQQTALRPVYTCGENYTPLRNSNIKEQIKEDMNRKCEPYVHQEIIETQETPQEKPDMTLEKFSIPAPPPPKVRQ